MKLKLLLDLSLKELRWLLGEFKQKLHLVFIDENGETMTDYSLPQDNTASIPLVYKDAGGVVIALPVGVSVASSDTSIVNVEVENDGVSVKITPVGVGTATVTAAVGPISGTLNVTVTAVVTPPSELASIDFDVANATLTPITAAPAPAPVVETGAPAA